jgi:hypothetical protein
LTLEQESREERRIQIVERFKTEPFDVLIKKYKNKVIHRLFVYLLSTNHFVFVFVDSRAIFKMRLTTFLVK